MRCLSADLHIHTGLSPCAAEEMTPPAIVQAAIGSGLAMIAICDHNAAGNTAATQEAARRAASVGPRGVTARRRTSEPGLTVLAGMEMTTAEEVHVVGLFPNPDAAMAAADEVRATLPEADDAYRQRFGEQRLMDGDGEIVGYETKMLALTSTIELSAAVQLIHRHGGVAIAAHVNRPSFSVLSQLGVFPTDAGFDAIEVFSPCGGDFRPAPPKPPLAEHGLPVINSSDSHFLADIGRARSTFELEEANFDELALALRGVGGRGVRDA